VALGETAPGLAARSLGLRLVEGRQGARRRLADAGGQQREDSCLLRHAAVAGRRPCSPGAVAAQSGHTRSIDLGFVTDAQGKAGRGKDSVAQWFNGPGTWLANVRDVTPLPLPSENEAGTDFSFSRSSFSGTRDRELREHGETSKITSTQTEWSLNIDIFLPH
jgi:hypothetical protein